MSHIAANSRLTTQPAELKLRYLIAEEAFKKIDIFEQRDSVGGVWNYTAEPGPGLPSSITSDPAAIFQTPSHGGDGAARNPAYVSPMYDQLETNLPRSLMQYSDLEFPSESQLFPQREVVMHYLQDYSVEVRNLIQFETHVEDVSLVPGANHDRWTVRTKHSASGNSTEGIYDAVIVASGHFEEPHIPPIPGLMSWIAAYPNSVIHSKAYRNPERFREKYVSKPLRTSP